MGNIAWREWECELMEEYAEQGAAGIRSQLSFQGIQRSLHAIRKKAEMLGIRLGPNRVAEPWLDEEVEVLHRHYLRGSQACLSELEAIGSTRTRIAVIRKLRVMGLRQRTCATCGQIFLPDNAQTICPECRRPALRKVRCIVCGEEFKTDVDGKVKCRSCAAYEVRTKLVRERLNTSCAPPCPWEAGHIWGTARDADPVLGF